MTRSIARLPLTDVRLFSGLSQAVASAKVPYWQSAHSLMRDVTVSGTSIVQRPAAGTFEPLRASALPQSFGPIVVSKASAGGAANIVHCIVYTLYCTLQSTVCILCS